jgi:hypothetical protein
MYISNFGVTSVVVLVDRLVRKHSPPGSPFLNVRNKDRLRPRYEVRIVPLFQNGFLPLALYRAKGYRVTWRYCLLCLA